PVDKAAVRAMIRNGTGVAGRAAVIKNALQGAGFTGSLLAVGNAPPTTATALYYPSTRADSAAAVAAALGIPSTAMHRSDSYSEVTVVIGADWTSATTYRGSNRTTAGAGSSGAPTSAAPSTAVASSPPSSSLLIHGDNAKACMYVPSPEW
ncbi:LytR C-terminal domain-containing protein, partial [Actinocrinis puniceicyclus]